MIEIVMLCVLTAHDISCMPFNRMQDCLSAEAGLATELVVESKCDRMEQIIHGTGPEKAPPPMEKPARG